jgi:hypothetical protein
VTLTAGALTLALSLVAAQGPRAAAKHRKPAHPAASATVARRAPPPPASRGLAPSPRRPEPTSVAPAETASAEASEGGSAAATPPTTVRPAKTKVYTFGAMDVEGKLKTPQLLYFLNRIKLELEMSAPDHRSFMKELEKTADDPSL